MSNASDIVALQNDIDQAIRAARRRNAVGLVLYPLAALMVAFWLWYAYSKFAAVDPHFAAHYAQARLMEYLPQAGQDLESSLVAYAPQAVSQVEARLGAIPDRFADELNARTRAELKAATPQMETEMYQSMRTALQQSQQGSASKGKDDAARFKSLLDALADGYRDESIKLVDQIRATHAANGSDVVAYIRLLGENKNLDRRQQLHRDLLQRFFVVAHRQPAPAVLPAPGK